MKLYEMLCNFFGCFSCKTLHYDHSEDAEDINMEEIPEWRYRSFVM